MTTLLITHDACLGHDNGRGHPERPDRLRAIARVLAAPDFAALRGIEAPLGSDEAILAAHPADYLALIRSTAARTRSGHAALDADTSMSAGSLEAALRAVGAATAAVDQVMTGMAANAFCAVRPPGHHAEPRQAMGFCLFANAAIAALHARAKHGAERIAVVDFDVHHGNGTQAIFWSDKDLFYGSTHQMPLYPGTGAVGETGVGNIFNAPLREGDRGDAFRFACTDRILPALDRFRPDLVVISAGFDAHHRDPLGGLRLTEADFAWITEKLVESAGRHCRGRVVSVLEGGYDLDGLSLSVGEHVRVLMAAGG